MRSQFSTHKYDRAFTGFLYERVLLDGHVDDEVSWPSGEFVCRHGRRLVFGTADGFVGSHTYPSEDGARIEMVHQHGAYEGSGAW